MINEPTMARNNTFIVKLGIYDCSFVLSAFDFLWMEHGSLMLNRDFEMPSQRHHSLNVWLLHMFG